ncbi:hypothetical protein BGZ74_008053 [Mortierella antarctica]|nr:hypothetical protein BGZ74_008053 [Mortierella antarctica]
MSEVLDDVQQPLKDYNHLAVKAKTIGRAPSSMGLLEDAPSSAAAEIPKSEVEQSNSVQIHSVSIDGSDVSDHEAAGSIPKCRIA